jgi:DNA-directed RNA polymerase specialized sigma24 family protein
MPSRSDDRRSITAAALAALLARLAPDPDRAAREYERLRRTLVRFFDWRGVWPPDECADETIDRLARKLETTAVEDVFEYARGIARLVGLERGRAPVLARVDLDASIAPAPRDEAGEELRDCFDSCLDGFSSDSRALVVGYYQGERTTKIENRRTMAAQLGLSDNALRSRVQRLRDRLESCVRECVARSAERLM